MALNLFQRMLKIEEELGVVAKNLKVETGKGKGYKAVSERDVIDAVKPLEAQFGVYSYPANREIVDRELIESVNDYGTTKTTFFSRIKTTYRFVNVDDPNEYIETVVFSEGIDSQDKGSGKAMTYADKYALMKAYKISTGDDPDEKPTEEIVYQKIDYVTKEQKTNLINTCEALGIDYEEVLTETGWKKGERLTNQQYAKAIVILNTRKAK